MEDPGAFPVAGDLAEALAETGQFEEASQVIGRLGRLAVASTIRGAWPPRTGGGRCGHPRGRERRRSSRRRPRPTRCWAAWEAARALLVLGRAPAPGQKTGAARDSLAAARAGFEQLGCPGWAQAAAAELDRISGRRATPGGLTPGERRVAELVAAGLSNKQVAEQLHVSVHTVEAHLSQVYAKLGTGSRTQLARALAPRG